MLSFLDAEVALDDEDLAWAREPECSPVWVSLRTLGSRRQFGGAFVTPARRALGLRGWEDAFEGTTESGAPWVLFDLEKLIRMALRQSGLAFELLTSPMNWTTPTLSPRELAEAALTRDIASYYLDVTDPLEGDVDAPGWRWRSLLTGWALSTRAVVSHDLATLMELAGVQSYSPQTARRLRDELRSGDALPARPSGYDWLNDLLVDARMEAE